MSFGERLKEARTLNNLTQEKLAELVGIDKMSISKYENGHMEPSAKTLLKLCSVLNVSAAFFNSEQRVQLKSKPAFRLEKKNDTLSEVEKQKIKTQTELAFSYYLDLLDFYGGSDDVKLPGLLPYLQKEAQSGADVDKLVEDIREFFHHKELPRDNLVEILEEIGFHFVFIDGPAKFEAVLFNESEHGPVIAVSRSAHLYRQLFSVAHETGHVFTINPKYALKNWDEESQANAFAAELLMPKEMIFRDFGRKRSSIAPEELFDFRDKYNVSLTALLNRLEHLEIISASQKQKISAAANREAWRLDKKGQIPADKLEKSSKMYKLVWRAYSEGAISGPKAEEILRKKLFTSTGVSSA